MNKRIVLVVLGTAFYLVLGIVLALSARAFTLHVLLSTLAIASIAVGVIVLAAAILALLVWGAKEAGGGIRGAVLIIVLLAVPVYFALQESPVEYPLGHMIAVAALAMLQIVAILVTVRAVGEESSMPHKVGTTLVLLPACILASSFVIVLVRASWTLFHRGYPLVTNILVGVVNPLWAIALVVAPPVLAGLLVDESKSGGRR